MHVSVRDVVKGVEDPTIPVGTREAVVPRAYLIPAEHATIVAKLRAHNIRAQPIDTPVRAEGEEFTIKGMRTVRSGGYEMTVLDGAMSALVTRDFPAGTVQVDMAQPMANAAFYYLEPQARDGFVGWGVMNDVLRHLTTGGRQATYPIFKMRREVK